MVYKPFFMLLFPLKAHIEFFNYLVYIFGRDVLFKYQFAARTSEKTLAIFFIISYTLNLSVLLTVLDDDNAMTGARS